jgi:gluconokinase
MGVCGSGKTTVGIALSERCGGVFYDADDFHPQSNIAKMKRGEPLDDADRAPWLDELALRLAAASVERPPVVLACSALKEQYRDILRSGCADLQFVHLCGTPEVIRARLAARTGHFMPEVLIDSQFAALEAPTGALVVDIDSSVEEVVETILSGLALVRGKSANI